MHNKKTRHFYTKVCIIKNMHDKTKPPTQLVVCNITRNNTVYLLVSGFQINQLRLIVYAETVIPCLNPVIVSPLFD